MAATLRPRPRPSLTASRKGPQALSEEAGLAIPLPTALNSTPNPVVTSLAGFAGGRHPYASRRPHSDPGTFKEALALSRRTPACCSMRRNGQSQSSQC